MSKYALDTALTIARVYFIPVHLNKSKIFGKFSYSEDAVNHARIETASDHVKVIRGLETKATFILLEEIYGKGGTPVVNNEIKQKEEGI